MLLVLGVVLAGCGGGEDNAGGGGTTDQASNEPVTLTLAHWHPEPRELIAAFEQANPNIDVKWQRKLYPDHLKDLKLKTASGEGYDVFYIQAGALAKEYAEFAEDLGPWAERQWGSDWKERFYPVGLEQSIVDGKVVGLPWELTTAGWVWYNADLFRQAGIAEPPSTWDELLADVRKLKAAGITPYIHGAKDNWINWDAFMAIANQTAPGVLYEAEQGEAEWTDPGLVRAMEIWKQFSQDVMQKGSAGMMQYPDAYERYYKGQAAMIMAGSWELAGSAAKSDPAQLRETFGITHFPLWLPFLFPDVDGDGQPASLTVSPATVPVMNAASEHKDAAWKWLAFLNDEPGQRDRARTLQLPGVKGYELDTSQVRHAAQRDVPAALIEQLASAQYPRELSYPEIQEALGQALQQVTSGQADPEAALESVQQASDRIRR